MYTPGQKRLMKKHRIGMGIGKGLICFYWLVIISFIFTHFVQEETSEIFTNFANAGGVVLIFSETLSFFSVSILSLVFMTAIFMKKEEDDDAQKQQKRHQAIMGGYSISPCDKYLLFLWNTVTDLIIVGMFIAAGGWWMVFGCIGFFGFAVQKSLIISVRRGVRKYVQNLEEAECTVLESVIVKTPEPSLN